MKRFAYVITRIFFALFYKIEVYNAEKVPKKGPALFCANHNTMMDMFFLGFKLKRWIYWMAKEELFRNPLLAILLRSLGAFPVKRGKGDVGSIKTAYKLLNKEKMVGIFPQGTRIDPSKLDTTKVKPGAAMIAVNAGVPIVPAMVEGSYKLFGKMRVIYGDPFTIENPEGRKFTGEELKELSRDILKRIYSLAEEVK